MKGFLSTSVLNSLAESWPQDRLLKTQASTCSSCLQTSELYQQWVCQDLKPKPREATKLMTLLSTLYSSLVPIPWLTKPVFMV